MELIRGLHNIRPHHEGCVATIGAFDGVHRGHQQVLKQLMAKGRAMGLPSVVVTLEPLPREFFAPLKAPPRIMNFREKFCALRETGIDRVLRIHFDKKVSEITAEDFIVDTFVKGLAVKYIVVGDDLRFGRDRGGDFSLLRRLGDEHGFEVVDTSTILHGEERVSSTRIRKALENDNFALAEKLLGKPYSISGRVVIGQQLGRTLGVPTANIQLRRISSALNGVYSVIVKGAGEKEYYGVANIGTRPTLDDSTEAVLEVNIHDFNDDIYGKKLEVVFCEKIREEKKFSSLDELKENIYRDIDVSRAFFGLAPIVR